MSLEDWQLPPVREGRPAPEELEARRRGTAAYREEPEEGVAVARRLVGGVPCTFLEVPVPALTLLYFHGGGYRMGDAEGWLGIASRIALAARARVILVEYRLAPEAPFPAALHDAASVYDALVTVDEEGLDTPPFVGGDSAGGGLAAALALAARGARVPMPAGLVLLSAWLDLTVTKPTYDSNAATDLFISKRSLREAAEIYLQLHDPSDPLASPLFADLSGLPPVLLLASCHEALLGDTTAFASRAAAAGVPVQAHLIPDVPHAWPAIDPKIPESTTAIAAIAHFLTPQPPP
ncbi:alpha/beta hydrolase fold domain-containing protein [Embleya hyalina]|uniref:Alpha/beta hydrolase n=1 Tax=Embleya hyalina TaxID=516124 RepID=A0A401Z752_9ACTN|nr:alpha/beta hydrolase fold domain-containing protein [Embleya hyalina]GCE02646.1 alpha/beta hydrolase [Embleya hyalina]